MSKTVFSEDSKIMLESLKVLLDLETLALKVKLCGSAHVSAVQHKKFLEKARLFAPQIDDISDQELRLQFNHFLRKLEKHVESIDEHNLTSLDLFRDILNTSLELYKDVEIIVYILLLPWDLNQLLNLGYLFTKHIVTSIGQYLILEQRMR